MNPLILIVVGYIIGMPILLRLIGVAHTKLIIQRQMQKMPKTRAAASNMPKPLWPKIREHISFAMKDTRPVSQKNAEGLSNKKVFWLIWAAGLGIAVAGYYTNPGFIAVGYLMFFAAIVFGMVKAKPIIEGRKKITQRAFAIGKQKLGISAEHEANVGAVFQVLEWREILKPSKVQYTFPPTFSSDSIEGFLKQFNEFFGTETAWVADNDPEKGPGWDFENETVRLKEMPPLPQRADWSEHYVLDPGVAWSFFPIAIGVENGVEVPNPNTGLVENVLGFDFSGEQIGLSKKLGRYASPNLQTSPMVLAAGGTGGGKALAISTPVLVKKVAHKQELESQ